MTASPVRWVEGHHYEVGDTVQLATRMPGAALFTRWTEHPASDSNKPDPQPRARKHFTYVSTRKWNAWWRQSPLDCWPLYSVL
jgi:hypothetical protein